MTTDEFLELLEHSANAAQREEIEALPYEPARPRGFVHTNVTGTRAQHELLRAWVSGVADEHRAATLRFLVHILTSTPHALRIEGSPARWHGYVPVYSRLIQQFARGADWKTLEDDGILYVRPYNRIWRRSREFRVVPERWHEFLEAGALVTASTGFDGDVVRRRRVDLATGKRSTRRVKSDRSTASRNPLPSLVRAAIDAVGPSPFNPASIREHLAGLRHRATAAPGGTGEAQRARARYLADLACAEAVFRQGAEPLDEDAPDGLWQYRPAYRMVYTGRIAQKGGGLQSCSRAMKTAAYTGVPDLLNLDLRSSQARILIALMDEAGVEPAWLRRYGDREEGKKEAAGYVRISVDAWKECLYAMLMGAYVATPDSVAYSQGKIKQTLLRDVGHGAVEETYARFLRLTHDLHEELGLWHEHLVTDFLREHGIPNNADGKTYVKNEVDATVAVEDLADEAAPYKLKGRLAAFLLQGREAAFTHTLAASSERYGFRVISHEHDGVVVVGTVPEVAVEEAAAAARLPEDLVDFVPKPFV